MFLIGYALAALIGFFLVFVGRLLGGILFYPVALILWSTWRVLRKDSYDVFWMIYATRMSLIIVVVGAASIAFITTLAIGLSYGEAIVAVVASFFTIKLEGIGTVWRALMI